ncbi:Alpha/beta hydrolase protein [Podospora aff. communis PSN243]|uniref:Alpha/beta hydrolase protein n=1 Tax=Podospora aff. communis PSN243 TaxID=3040156 RepID=A0AAV9GB95_9PEZI|nr:Alpha/beta hydrolase protein [Podospora aff. communis PSN243]
MPFLDLIDGNSMYYKDWGNITGPPVVFSHGWPLNSDNWENQMNFLGNHGYRVIAHDRRGHGRSSQPWTGNNMDTYASDLLQLYLHLNLTRTTLIGHSTGGGEVARFLGLYTSSTPYTDLVSRAVLVGSITPILGAVPSNPHGVPLSVFQSQRDTIDTHGRAQLFHDIPSGPFYNFDLHPENKSLGLIQSWFEQAMQSGLVNAYDCITAFSETDFTEDLKKVEVPVLVIHGSEDQLVPMESTAKRAVRLLKKGTLKVYEGADHGLPDTHVERVNRDLLEFIRGG